MSEIPRSHPRYQSLMLRDRLVDGLKRGLCSEAGLIAHGRGEALDYLLGERTHDFAIEAIEAASALLWMANHAMLSINGNVASLAGQEIVDLTRAFPMVGLEVNLFHHSPERSHKIAEHLRNLGASRVLEAVGAGSEVLGEIQHARKFMHPEGIAKADLVLVALEDGDRCQALVNSGRRVIAIDLNPLSRTAKMAYVSIVDELTRCLGLLHRQLESDKSRSREELKRRIVGWDNAAILRRAESALRGGST